MRERQPSATEARRTARAAQEAGARRARWRGRPGARHAPPKDIPEHELTPLLAAPAETSVESPAESTGDTGGWAESQEFHAREAQAG